MAISAAINNGFYQVTRQILEKGPAPIAVAATSASAMAILGSFYLINLRISNNNGFSQIRISSVIVEILTVSLSVVLVVELGTYYLVHGGIPVRMAFVPICFCTLFRFADDYSTEIGICARKLSNIVSRFWNWNNTASNQKPTVNEILHELRQASKVKVTKTNNDKGQPGIVNICTLSHGEFFKNALVPYLSAKDILNLVSTCREINKIPDIRTLIYHKRLLEELEDKVKNHPDLFKTDSWKEHFPELISGLKVLCHWDSLFTYYFINLIFHGDESKRAALLAIVGNELCSKGRHLDAAEFSFEAERSLKNILQDNHFKEKIQQNDSCEDAKILFIIAKQLIEAYVSNKQNLHQCFEIAQLYYKTFFPSNQAIPLVDPFNKRRIYVLSLYRTIFSKLSKESARCCVDEIEDKGLRDLLSNLFIKNASQSSSTSFVHFKMNPEQLEQYEQVSKEHCKVFCRIFPGIEEFVNRFIKNLPILSEILRCIINKAKQEDECFKRLHEMDNAVNFMNVFDCIGAHTQEGDLYTHGLLEMSAEGPRPSRGILTFCLTIAYRVLPTFKTNRLTASTFFDTTFKDCIGLEWNKIASLCDRFENSSSSGEKMLCLKEAKKLGQGANVNIFVALSKLFGLLVPLLAGQRNNEILSFSEEFKRLLKMDNSPKFIEDVKKQIEEAKKQAMAEIGEEKIAYNAKQILITHILRTVFEINSKVTDAEKILNLLSVIEFVDKELNQSEEAKKEPFPANNNADAVR